MPRRGRALICASGSSGKGDALPYSMSPQVHTGRWADARHLPAFYVPVRISIGKPRYWPESAAFDAIHELMPYQIFGHVQQRDEFERRYRAHLDEVGVGRIQRRFDDLAARHANRPLVLLCYEDLSRPGAWCHRVMFAAWWLERTGQAIVDVNHAPEPDPAPTLAQASLFA